jgi:hypothetical protein
MTAGEPHWDDPAPLPEKWLARCVPLIGAMIHGQDAGLAADGPSAVVALPVWLWVKDTAGWVGSKSAGPDGQRLAVPVRIVWDFPAPRCVCGKTVCLCKLRDPATGRPHRDHPVRVVPAGRTVTARWRLAGLGLSHTGQTTITAAPGAEEATVTRWARFGRDGQWTRTVRHAAAGMGVPVSMTVPAVPAQEANTALSALRRDAVKAKWELAESVNKPIKTAISAAQHRLALQVAALRGVPRDDVRDMLDEATRAQLAIDLTLPSKERPRATIWGTLDKFLIPDAFQNADPVKCLRRAIWRDAGNAVRRHLGDPKMGDRIRASYLRDRPASLDALMDQLRRDCPHDHLTLGVVSRALTLGHDANAGTWSVETAWPGLPAPARRPPRPSDEDGDGDENG